MSKQLKKTHDGTELVYGRVNQAVWNTLKSSVFPGANDDSICMAIDYCIARKLDILQKPVHIVPMQVKTGKKDVKGFDIYEWRDVILPGISLYRTQAARTNEYVGKTKPKYGTAITTKLGDKAVTYPEDCTMSIFRIKNGRVCEFEHTEDWTENYATKGKNSVEPNAMWSRRPKGQLAKCTEAQLLRMAFPDEVGSQPTAEEMEGKIIDHDDEILQQQPVTPIAGKGMSSLKAKLGAAEHIDTETGEIYEQESTSPSKDSPATLDQFKASIEAATNMQEAVDAMNEGIKNGGTTEELKALKEAFALKKAQLT
jgi:phage recombination protein Bet